MIRLFKLLILIFSSALIFFHSIVIAADTPANKWAAKKNEARYLSGTVLASSFADANLGTKSEIYVIDPKGNTISCIITDTTTMYDDKGNPITLDKLTKGLSVKIKYVVTKSGIKEAQLIKILQQ